MRRLVGAPLAAGLLSLALVPAAYAGGNVFAGYVTRVQAVRPALPGVKANAASNGAYITVSNASSIPLIVDGYQQEPYLKITNHGVWQNGLSPAVYLNKEQFIDSIPSDVNAKKPPVWVRISSLSSAQWHDHRIHWMDVSQPPAVAAAPDKPHLIKRWSIPISSGSTSGDIVGTLTWYPSKHLVSYLTWGIPGLAVLVVLALVLWRRRTRSGPTQVGGSETIGAVSR